MCSLSVLYISIGYNRLLLMSQAKMPFIAVDIKICRKWLISSNQLKTRKLIMCSVVLIDVQSCYRV